EIGEELPLDPVGEDSQLYRRLLGEVVRKLLGKTGQFLAGILCLHEEGKGGADEEGPVDGLGGSVLAEIYLPFGLALAWVGHVVAEDAEQRRDETRLRSRLVAAAVLMPFLDPRDVLRKLLFHGGCSGRPGQGPRQNSTWPRPLAGRGKHCVCR